MIEIKQTCNGCYKERTLTGSQTEAHAGWRKIDANIHLCPECIAKALGQTND